MATLKGYLAAAEEGKLHVSEKVKAFWRAKLTFHEGLLQVLEPIGNEELKKQYLEKANQVWQVGLKEVLEKVNKELVGPYALGLSHFRLYSSFLHLFSHAYRFFHHHPPFPDPTGPSEIDTMTNRWLTCVLHLGDQPSLADIHLAVWLARIAHLSGALPSDDGNSVIEKIEVLVGTKFAKDISIVEARRRAGLGSTVNPPEGKTGGPAPQTIQPSTDKNSRQSRLAAFWEAIKERPSWKKVYEAGLH